MKISWVSLWGCLFLVGCKVPHQSEFTQTLQNAPSIAGKAEYLTSPFVTAGNRVYMVGHQDGSFPELGWHITGEMGGIWNHPIKLMDGFEVELALDGNTYALDKASSFMNYPFANAHFFEFTEADIAVERYQFVPDNREGLVVQFVLQNNSEADKTIHVQTKAHADLRPTWLGDRTNMHDAPDRATFHNNVKLWLFSDEQNPWYAVFGLSDSIRAHHQEPSPYQGKGVTGVSEMELSIPAGKSAEFSLIISGSYQSQEKALETYQFIKHSWPILLQQKRDAYQQISHQTKLTIPDKQLQQTFEWLKYNSAWLVRTVPEIGTGIGAGIPDYPWWFGVDSEYALQGYMAIGMHNVVYSTIQLLDSVSNAVNGNGRIIHEMSTNGAVFNPGNINETPQFASLIWEIFKWNGDQKFLETYFPTVEKGLEWLLTQNDANSNLFPDGFGMMEIHGLNSEMIDVAAYTQRAFLDASFMAEKLGKQQLAEKYRGISHKLARKINTDFWSEEFNSFADFIGTDQQALHLIDDAIIRADTLNKPWAVAELEQTRQAILENPSAVERPFVVHHNWVVNTPMQVGVADPEKARKALETAQQFVNPFGVFVTGIDRDASAGSDEGSFQGSKIFSYTGAVMTLPTGVLAVAENNYNRPDQALNYLQRMSRTFSYALPGSMYEVSPDYGMMAQAWNIYSFAVPIVHQFFGVDPMASEKTIYLRPLMPTEWKSASLENVKIGDNELSLHYTSNGETAHLRVSQTQNWNIVYAPRGTIDPSISSSRDKSSYSWGLHTN